MFRYTCPLMEWSLAGLTGGPANIAQVSLPTPPRCGLPGAFTCYTHESCVQGWSPPTQLWSRRSPWPRLRPLRSDRVGARRFSRQRSGVRAGVGKHTGSQAPGGGCTGPPGCPAGPAAVLGGQGLQEERPASPPEDSSPQAPRRAPAGEGADSAASRAPRAAFVWLQGRTSGGPRGHGDSRGPWGVGLALAALAVRPRSAGRFLMEWFEMKTRVVHQMPSSAW